MYHYAANNPVKYTDPDGRVVIKLGISGQAGAGIAGAVETGIAVGFSLKEGITFGSYTTKAVGAEFGIVYFAGITVTLDTNSKKVETNSSRLLIIGGSGEKIIGVGLDFSYDLDSRQIDVSIINGKNFIEKKFKIGGGDNPTIVEFHIMYSTTQTKRIDIKQIFEKIGISLINLEKNIENNLIEKCTGVKNCLYW